MRFRKTWQGGWWQFGHLCEIPMCLLWMRTETSLPYVQCFLYLVSSSINVSIFHSTWLDTFWTDLVFALLGLAWRVTQKEILGEIPCPIHNCTFWCANEVYSLCSVNLLGFSVLAWIGQDQMRDSLWRLLPTGQGASRTWLLCLGPRNRNRHFDVWGYQRAKSQHQKPNGWGRVWHLISEIRSNS